MAEQGHQAALLANILHSLTAIDARLSRIENTLQIPTLNNTNAINTIPAASLPSNVGALNNGINIPVQRARAHTHQHQSQTQTQQQQQQNQLQLQQLAATPPTPAPLNNTLISSSFGAPQQQQALPPIAPPPPPALNQTPLFQPFPSHPALKPLEPPPEGFPVSSRAALQEELDNWTVPRGYSMRINGTRTHGSRSKIRLVCFRGGRARARARSPASAETIAAARAAGRRKPTTDRASKKCDCPFRFELVETSAGAGRFSVHFTSRDGMGHNHGPSADLRLDPRARKIPSVFVGEVDAWLREGMAIAKIQEELRKRGVATVLDFDLRNRKRTLQKKDGLLGGTQAQMEEGEQHVDLDVSAHFGLDDEDAEGMDDE